MSIELNSISEEQPTFAGFARCAELKSIDADVAIIGIPYQSPYAVSITGDPEAVPDSSTTTASPAAIRQQSQRYTDGIKPYDFDFGGELFAGRKIKVVDCGDVVLLPEEHEVNLIYITKAVRMILAQGAVPIVLGGDHGTRFPYLGLMRNMAQSA